jgi:serine/threonine protein kinase
VGNTGSSRGNTDLWKFSAKLADPSIVVVHEVVHEDDRPWIVMELVQGRTLQQVIDEEGPQPPEWAAKVGAKVLASLRAVHRADVVHRDIKPSNILLDGERTVLTDFGIAALDGSTVLTRTGAILGTVAFSPDGRTVASGGADHKVILNNAATSVRIATLTGHKGQVDWVTFSPDGKTLASGAEDKSIRLWDLTH